MAERYIENTKADEKISAQYPTDGFPVKVIMDAEYKTVGIFVGEGRGLHERSDELVK